MNHGIIWTSHGMNVRSCVCAFSRSHLMHLFIECVTNSQISKLLTISKYPYRFQHNNYYRFTISDFIKSTPILVGFIPDFTGVHVCDSVCVWIWWALLTRISETPIHHRYWIGFGIKCESILSTAFASYHIRHIQRLMWHVGNTAYNQHKQYHSNE